MPGAPQVHRGGPLASLDVHTRAAIKQLRDIGEEAVDCDAATAIWEEALRVPAWDDPPVWLHAHLLPADAREIFRESLAVDDPTWIRGRARTLSQALIALPYYRTTNPAMAITARHVIRAVLTEA